MPKLLFPDRVQRSPTAIPAAVLPSTFRLMRDVAEYADRVTKAISEAVSARELGFAPQGISSGAPFFMEFWNMKQRGELTADEPAATWAILMRAVDVPVALRILLANCATAPAEKLFQLVQIYQSNSGHLVTPPYVMKLRTKLCEALRDAAAVRAAGHSVLDPIDAYLYLSACEAALVAEQEEKRRWHTAPR